MVFCGFFLALVVFPVSAVPAQDAWEELQPIAEAQHEIILLLIERREFSKVPGAARKVFELPFPAEQEHRLVNEAVLLTSALLHHEQMSIAHQILDEAIVCVRLPQSRSRLIREKAFVFKKEGKSDEAIREYEKSMLELEKGRSPH